MTNIWAPTPRCALAWDGTDTVKRYHCIHGVLGCAWRVCLSLQKQLLYFEWSPPWHFNQLFSGHGEEHVGTVVSSVAFDFACGSSGLGLLILRSGIVPTAIWHLPLRSGIVPTALGSPCKGWIENLGSNANLHLPNASLSAKTYQTSSQIGGVCSLGKTLIKWF